ncbi:CvpA family protein [Malikia sp.]|uniref:CvpA family protein n=1 Tax=Malikia sp. TaxID=2070706 RepID=UPI0026301F68|nr:CvpA family protein [Malikia sp.]MDD2729030.1 CvpA family protein [Malikia sp.]
MVAVDLFLLLLLLASVLLGMWRGLSYELLSIAGWIAAFMVAQWLAGWAAAQLPLNEFSEPLRYAAGFVVVFVVAAFGAGLLSWFISKLFESVGLRPVDRVLGAAFGLLRGVATLLALALVVNMTPLKQQEGWQASAGARGLEQGLRLLKAAVPDRLARYFP